MVFVQATEQRRVHAPGHWLQEPTTQPMKTCMRIPTMAAPIAAVALASLIVSPQPGQAANRTWTNAPTDANWSTAANWVENVAPATTDTLFFNTSSITTLYHDLVTPLFLRGITFGVGGDAFTLGGNPFIIDGNIANLSANAQVINMDATLNFDRVLTGTPHFTFGGLFLNSGGNRAFYHRLDGGTLFLNNVTLSEHATTGRTLTFIGSASGAMAQANTTISGVVANGSTGSSTLEFFGTGTLKLNGTIASTYTGASTIRAGTLLLDFANLASGVNLLDPASTLTLGGGTYSILGKSSGATFQTNGNLTLTGSTGSGITLNNNGGAGTTLKTGNWTRNGNSTLLVDVSAGGTLAHGATAPNNANGILNPAYGTVKDVTGAGFATVSGGTVIRYTGATALADNSDDAAVNYRYVADGTTFNWNNGITTRAVNSLAIDSTANGGTLDLGGAGNIVSNSSRGFLLTGGNHFTIQNGQLGAASTEVIIHVMGAGVLTNKATISGGTGTLTKGGPGTLVLAAANNYSNGTHVTEGTLKLGAANALGAPDRVVQVSAGGVLDLNGMDLSVGYIGGNGGGVIVNNGSGAATLYLGSNNVASSGGTTYTIVEGASPLHLVKVGTAQVQLSGASSWSGGITVSGGNSTALRVNNSAGLGVGTITLNDGGIFTPSGNPMAGGNGQMLMNTNYHIVGNSANNRLQNDINGFTYIGSFTGSGTVKVDENTRANGNANFTGDFSAFTGTFNVAAGSGVTFQARLTQNGGAAAKFTLSTAGSGLYFNGTGAFTNISLGELSGISSTTLAGDSAAKTLTIGALNTSSTFGGTIANGNAVMSVTKVGTGVLTLGSAATYTGNTVVSNGLLFVAGLNSPSVTVVAPGAFGGSGNVPGPVTLIGSTAGLFLTNGVADTLYIGNGTSGLTLENGNRLAFDVAASPTTDNVAINGPLTQTGTATVYISQAAGFGAGTFTLITAASGISAANFVLGTTLPGYNLSLTDDGAGTALFLNVSVSAPPAAFWHNRSGTAWNVAANWDDDQFSNNQLSTPPSNPTDVTFTAAAASSFNTTLGANMAIHNLIFNTPSAVTVGGTNMLTIGGNVVVNSGSGNHTISASGVTLGVDQTWTVSDGSQTLNVSAPVSGGKALTIGGAGTVALSGNNSYSAGTLVKDTATLALNHPSDTLGNTGPVAVDGGTINIGANSDIVGAVSLTNGAIIGTSGVLTGSVYHVENGILSARLGGSASLTKATTGTVLVSGDNSFAGGANIGAGVLQLGSSTALGTGNATVVAGATLDLNGQTNTTVTSVSGGGATGGAIINSSTNAAAIHSEIVNGQGYTVDATGDITIQRTRSGGGTFQVTKTGPGTVIFGTPAATTHNNLMALIVSQGKAVLNMPGVFSVDRDPCGVDTGATLQLAGTGGNQINDGTTVTLNTGAWFDMNGRSELIGYLTAAAGSLVTNSLSASNSVLNIGGGNGGAATGACQVDGEIAGPMGLGKFGSGTMILTASNTYSGTTTVGAGSIILSGDGSIGHSTNINILSAATLDVTTRTDGKLTLLTNQTLMGGGVLNGELATLPGSIVNPGANVGTLTVNGNITLGGQLRLELNRGLTPNHDVLTNSSGTITYSGTLTVTNIGAALEVNDKFQLFPGAVTAFGGIALATNDATGNIYTWQNDIATDGSITVLTVTPAINPNPPVLQGAFAGGVLNLSWPTNAGWILQAQTNSRSIGRSSNWVDISGSALMTSTNLTVNPADPTVFFRMRYP
jgi:fibronectin-binding autotransporter adhesin